MRGHSQARNWWVVITGSIGSAAGIAALPFYGLSSFMRPLEAEFGWTRAQIGFASTCLTIGLFTTAPLIGKACDRFGVARTVVPSIVLLSLAFAGLTLIGPNVYSLYVGYLLLAFLGAGTSPVAYVTAVAPRFDSHRGLALGITLAGTGVAGFFAPRILSGVIEHHGWRAGWLTLAALALVALPLATVFLRQEADSPSKSGVETVAAGRTLREALASLRFWIIAGAFFSISLGISGLIVNMVPMLQDAGLSLARAAQIASLIGVGVVVARLFIGYVVDRVYAPAVGAGVFTLTAIGCWLLGAGGPVVAPYAALLIGCAMGAEVDLIAYLVSRYFGLRHYGAIGGCGYASYNIGAAISPVAIGAMFAAYGDYALALKLTAALCTLGGVALLFLGPYPSAYAPVRTHSAE